MKQIIVVKVGTQLLTTASGELDLNSLRNISYQAADLQIKHQKSVVLVSSGAITCGKEILNISCNNLPEKQAAAAIGQINLCHQYRLFFGEKNCKIGQVLLTKDGLEDPKRRVLALDTFSTLLKYNVIPIVNENDTVAVDEINYGDNDQLAGDVAQLLNAESVIFLTNVNGFYQNKDDSEPIEWLNTISNEHLKQCQKPVHQNSRGGMYSKLSVAKTLLNLNIPVIISNGRTPDILSKLILGEGVGTYISKTNPPKHYKSV